IELGYTDEVVQKTIVVGDGENLDLPYVKISPAATIPSLVTPEGKLYDSTLTVVKYLLDNAPQKDKVKYSSDTKLLEIVHEDSIDPNTFFLAARSEEELAAKRKAFPMHFVSSQTLASAGQKVLERVKPIAPPELKDFYDQKYKGNSGLLAIYTEGASSEVTAPWFKMSQANWDAIGNFITQVLPTYLPEQGLLGGDTPNETDYHVGAYLARIADVLGAKSEKGAASIFKVFTGEVPASVLQYWDTWVVRPSWETVYKHGLH
ncbi:7782_t:CDS:2, partial [Acaulospora colombiana]